MKTKKGPARNKQKKIICKFVETKTYDQRETIGIVWFTSFKGCCSLLHSKSKRCALHQNFWKTLCRLANDFRHVLTGKICWHRHCCCLMGWLLFKCWLLFSLPSESGYFSFWLVGDFLRGVSSLPIRSHFLLPIFLSGVDRFLHYFMLNFPITSAWCVSIVCKVQHRSAPFWKW